MTDTEYNKERKYERKIDLWEKKLFDLTLRNALLSARIRSNVIPFEIRPGELAAFMEALCAGTSFSVCPCGTDAGIAPAPDCINEVTDVQEPDVQEPGVQKADVPETDVQEPDVQKADVQEPDVQQAGAIAQPVSSGLLSAAGTPHSLSTQLKRLARVARSSVEETGSANLYWGIGLLRWFDKKTPDQERFAPLLLLPAEIVRGQGEIPFRVRAADEEPLINQTLLEKLRIDYNLAGADFSDLIRDGDDFDLGAVLDRFRAMTAPMQGWEILEKPCLGIFSYAKYMMWEDLHEHREEILGSRIVRSLAGGTIEWHEEMDTWQAECAGHEILTPVSLDSSQRLAVRAAAAGKSFVLHGPPGTGKSQTITAIIANALAQGQTVLFVAEKMAALSVVQSRLEQLGLDDFCLEIHSRKSRKKDVIEKLRRAAEAYENPKTTTYNQLDSRQKERISDAQTYLQHLHRKGAADLSVWELMDLYERFPAELPEQKLKEGEGATAAALTPADLAARREALEKLIAAGRAVGHPGGHPLAPIGKTVYTQEFRMQMEDQIQKYLDTVEALDRALDLYAQKTGQAKPSGIADLQRAIDINNELDCWNSLPMIWAQSPAAELALRLQKADAAVKHCQSLTMYRDRLLKVFGPEILQIAEEEADRLRGSYDKARKSWALPQYLGKRRLETELSEYSADGQKIGRRRLGQYTQDIQNYQKELRLYHEALQACGDDLDAFRDTEGNLMIPALYKAVQTAVQSTKRLQALTGSDGIRLERAGRPVLREQVRLLKAASENLQKQERDLKAFLEFRDTQRMRELEEKDWFAAQREFCALLRENRSGLREWILWNRARQEASALGLDSVIDAYCGGLAHDHVIASWQKTWTRAALREMIEKDPVLNTFSGILLEEQISAIRTLDQELTQLAREEIRMRLRANVPEFVEEAPDNPLLSTFRRIILGGGKGMSIRDILTVTAPVLPRLCPCMLMSPVSAAQYLAPERAPFDLVIFDEASQITTANAIGVLARGRNAVIVGDPNQMPPTNFFAREIDLVEDPLEDDLGSILEDCIAVNMPQLYLSWHYRSRHESLIAFSNEQFYDGRLFTFPSSDDGVCKVSLDFVDGLFESGARRINRAEAEAIIAELQRRSRTPETSGQSVGIVTFNIQQQSLIEDLYDEARRQDQTLARWDQQAGEPLFIKNLENVQGDERDVILFSTTYGPSPEGRMSLNFGPLNREGGWKRLNVAITRAREEMVIFTSIRPEKAGLSGSLSTGVRMLDAFLRYAACQTQRETADSALPETAAASAANTASASASADASVSAAASTAADAANTVSASAAGDASVSAAATTTADEANTASVSAAADASAADLGSLRLSMAGTWLRRNDHGVSGIALEIKEALQKQGLKAVCGIGRSSFRVDLGITDPAQPERYQLGILLDTEHLESDRTFSDLEIGRKKVLENLGWKLLSVRAIDWYDSPDKVLSQITEMLL